MILGNSFLSGISSMAACSGCKRWITFNTFLFPGRRKDQFVIVDQAVFSQKNRRKKILFVD